MDDAELVESVFNSLEKFNNDEESRVLLTECQRSIFIGTLHMVATYTGTTSFSTPNSIISWNDFSFLFHQALIRANMGNITLSNTQLQSQLKAIYARIRLGTSPLNCMEANFNRLNKQNLILDKDIEDLFLGSKLVKLNFQEQIGNGRKNGWTIKEEAILFGAILEVLKARGTFKVKRDEDSPWLTIKRKFDIKREYLRERDEAIPLRTHTALSRRYKIMKASLAASNGNKLYFKQLYVYYLDLMQKKIEADQGLHFSTLEVS